MRLKEVNQMNQLIYNQKKEVIEEEYKRVLIDLTTKGPIRPYTKR